MILSIIWAVLAILSALSFVSSMFVKECASQLLVVGWVFNVLMWSVYLGMKYKG